MDLREGLASCELLQDPDHTWCCHLLEVPGAGDVEKIGMPCLPRGCRTGLVAGKHLARNAAIQVGTTVEDCGAPGLRLEWGCSVVEDCGVRGVGKPSRCIEAGDCEILVSGLQSGYKVVLVHFDL